MSPKKSTRTKRSSTSNTALLEENALSVALENTPQLPALKFKPEEDPESLTGLSSSSLKRAPLSGPNRIQSQLFTVSRTVNPLVAAAAPLLSLATRLGELMSTPDLKKLYEQLSHEVKVFEYKAQSLAYKAQVIIAARYILCTLIDETIQNSAWGEKAHWEKNNLLNHFQHESEGGERCFYILEQALEDSVLYFDLLELYYLCLSLGLEGKFRGNRNGADEIHALLETLFQLILNHRGEPSKKLWIEPQENTQAKKALSWHLPPVWVTGSLGAVLLFAIYWPYHKHLQELAAPVDEALKNLSTLQISVEPA